jgi:hypothetical protein
MSCTPICCSIDELTGGAGVSEEPLGRTKGSSRSSSRAPRSRTSTK